MSWPDHVTCVVQARMGSSRLPGKVLEPVGGRPMLVFLLERLSSTPFSRLVVATSDLPRDDPVAATASSVGVEVFRGSESDVLGRFAGAVGGGPTDHVVRITGDCPLVDPGVVADVVALHVHSGADYTSNVFPRTFPKGLDVEVMRSSSLELAASEATLDVEREHVTPFFYRRPQRFKLANLRSGLDAGWIRWTVDTADDLDRIRGIVDRSGLRSGGGAPASWREVLDVVGPTGPPEGLRLRPADETDSSYLLELRNERDSVRFSRTGSPVAASDHASWFERVLQDPSVDLRMAELDGAKVGTVRVDTGDGSGEVSVVVAPAFRGQSMARRVLQELVEDYEGSCQVDELVATVRSDNAASTRSFAGAGFTTAGSDDGWDRWVWVPLRLR